MRRAVLAAIFAVLSLPAPAALADVVSDYPAAGSRTFATGVGGWTASSQVGGGCVPGLTCPTLTNSFQPTGGAGGGGDGHLRSQLTDVDGVPATSTATWESPGFVYKGAGGATPEELTLNIDSRATVDDLVAVGGDADFTVEVVETAGGAVAATPVDAELLYEDVEWAETGPWDLAPAELVIGRSYKIRVTTRFYNGSAVASGANADYDNVVLEAATFGSGGGGGAAGGLTKSELLTLIRFDGLGQATLRNGKLRVRPRCPGQAPASCRISLVAIATRVGPALTDRRSAVVAPGRSRAIVLPVKPRFLALVSLRGKLRFRETVRVGGLTVVVDKSLKIRH